MRKIVKNGLISVYLLESRDSYRLICNFATEILLSSRLRSIQRTYRNFAEI